MIVPTGGSVESAIAFMESKIEWITATRQKMQRRKEEFDSRNVVVTDNTTVEDLMALYKRAVEHLPTRVAELSKQAGLPYRTMKIGRARSRWGSCSSDNRIMLTIYIMALPDHLIDFIILHELCHTRHHNHSAEFHQLVNQLTNGREKLLERELKGWRIF